MDILSPPRQSKTLVTAGQIDCPLGKTGGSFFIPKCWFFYSEGSVQKAENA